MTATEPVKIASLEIESFKRIEAVSLTPTKDGLTIIGGGNRQGKSSIIDAIVYALGGAKNKPSNAMNQKIEKNPSILIELSNGIVVRRDGKNGALKVTSKEGLKGNQTLLDQFIEELALNLPQFMSASAKDKASKLLSIIGVGDQLNGFDASIESLFQKRKDHNRDVNRLETQFNGLPEYNSDIDDVVVIEPLLEEIENIRVARLQRDNLVSHIESTKHLQNGAIKKVNEMIIDIQRIKKDVTEYEKIIVHNDQKLCALQIEDDQPIINKITEMSVTNEKIARQTLENENYHKLKNDLNSYKHLQRTCDEKLQHSKKLREKLLEGANMPLVGLSVISGELVFQGQNWDGMSGSQQLIVATSIIRGINPSCGFVLLDKLEAMDLDTLSEFADWAQSEELQIIATRVSQGDECSLIIEEGKVR